MSEPVITSLVNGKPAGCVDTGDRGLHYGDGLFETIAVHDGRTLHWDRHLKRLLRGCERLAIPAPDSGLLMVEATRMSSGHARAVLKLILTRGGSRRGYQMEAVATANRIWRTHAWPDYPSRYRQDGVAVCVCRTPLARQPRLAGLKHLNRLEQVLARNEWQQEYEEGLMLDTDGNVIEGVASNLFAVKHGDLRTPRLDQCGVHGVTRERVMDAARRLGWRCQEVALRQDELLAADEIFLTNTLFGIWPVNRIEVETPARVSHTFAVGPVTRRLQEQLALD